MQKGMQMEEPGWSITVMHVATNTDRRFVLINSDLAQDPLSEWAQTPKRFAWVRLWMTEWSRAEFRWKTATWITTLLMTVWDVFKRNLRSFISEALEWFKHGFIFKSCAWRWRFKQSLSKWDQCGVYHERRRHEVMLLITARWIMNSPLRL